MPSARAKAGLLGVTLATLVGAGAPEAVASHVQCGDVLTADTTLDSDLIDCPGDGVVIGADGITLDLDGHTIRRGGACGGDGVDNRAGHRGVTVRDGVITGFGNAVAIAGASGNRLHDLRVNGCGTGILLVDSRHNQIVHNRAAAFDGAAIFFVNADGNLVAGNSATGGGIAGIMLTEGSDHNRIVRNSAFEVGITTPLSGTGIRIDSGQGNVVLSNAAIHNRRRGIHVAAGAFDTLVERNRADGTGSILRQVGDGIVVESTATTVTRNTANFNGNLGIKAVEGVKDGGGNRARGNGNPAQCENVACSP